MSNNTDKTLYKEIFTLALPTMAEQFLGTAVQYIDTAMVGLLGTFATAAVGSTSTFNWLFGSSISAFGVGFLAYISQALGAKDEKRARRAGGQAVFMVFAVGLFFTLVTLSISRLVPAWMNVDESIRDLSSRYFFVIYAPSLFRTASIIFGTCLRAAGDTKTPMQVGIAVNGINIVSNFFLIYETRKVSLFGLSLLIPGAGMGVMGAAFATALSFIAGGVMMAVAFFKSKDISPKGVKLMPDGEILKPCLRVAFPNMFQRFCTSLGYVVFASMINSLGELSTAAHTIANTVESAFYIPGFGMQTAAATLTGNAVGAGDKEREKRLFKAICLIETSMMVVSGALLFAFAPDMVSVFSKDPAVIALCSKVLRMVSLSEPFYGIAIVIEGMLFGAGETKIPFLFSVSTMWLIRIFGTFLCINVFGLGLISAWGCMIGNNLTNCALFAMYKLVWKKE